MNKEKAAKILPVIAAILVVSVVIGCISLKSKNKEKNNEEITVPYSENVYTFEEYEPTEAETAWYSILSSEPTAQTQTTSEKKSEKETESDTEASKKPETSEDKATEKKTEKDKDGTTEKPTSKTTTSKKSTTTKASTSKKTTTTEKVTGATYIKGILVVNKSYALPSSYAPGVNAEAKKAFDRMAADAAKEGLDLWIRSGYRSYSRQKEIYNNYVAEDGKAAADRYSARPGHSEHQTGLAFDVNSLSQSFENTAEGKWLAKNCWKYGFIIRYPKGKESITGYMYEPWHIRYLGADNAKAVHDSGLTLEEYLGVDSKYKN